jgi:nucleoside-diphosphate-sugar epimerase
VTKRALLLGGTGAMGIYLAPALAEAGFEVYSTSRRTRKSVAKTQFIKGDAHDKQFVSNVLKAREYDVIIDFMIYTTEEFKDRIDILLGNTKQYIFLSSYRVFSDARKITEKTPRLIDVSSDKEFLSTSDYSLVKAQQEDLLRVSQKKNWTIVRPGITYSQGRFQLGTLESDLVVWRALQRVPTILPRTMLSKVTTMTWAGDVAKMITGLVLNDKAYGEDFNVTTKEHHLWSEVAGIYKQEIGLDIISVKKDEYIESLGGGYVKYQVDYDRMYNRVLDNSKVLKATGLKESDFISLSDGLKHELREFMKKPVFENIDYAKQAKVDRLTNSILNIKAMNTDEKKTYIKNRFPRFAGNVQYTKHATDKLRAKVRIRTRINEAKARIDEAKARTHAKKELNRIKSEAEAKQKKYIKDNSEFFKSDGAILTLPGYFNYGNLAQRFALQYFLKSHKFKFVSYVRDMPIETVADEKRFKYTYDFVERNIWRKQFDERDAFKSYIVGSDQVWRNWTYDDVFHSLGYFFLDFTRDMKTKRIAYAASFGQDTLEDALISDEFAQHVKPVIKSFASVGMRELSGVDLVKEEWGVDSRLVVDPTLLLNAKDYDSLIEKAPYKLKKTTPIFTYFIRNNESKKKLTRKICKMADLESSGIDLEDAKKQLEPVEYWIKSIRDAELLVTDSFHGVVFAVIYNTPFILLESGTGGVGRTATLLGRLGLEDRYVTSDKIAEFKLEAIAPIDWSNVNRIVSQMRKQSSKWLVRAVRTKRGKKAVR